MKEKAFLDYLEEKLDYYAERDQDEFKKFLMEDEEWLSKKELLDQVMDTARFTNLCKKHASWIL